MDENSVFDRILYVNHPIIGFFYVYAVSFLSFSAVDDLSGSLGLGSMGVNRYGLSLIMGTMTWWNLRRRVLTRDARTSLQAPTP